MNYVRLCCISLIYKMSRLTVECNLKGGGGGAGVEQRQAEMGFL